MNRQIEPYFVIVSYWSRSSVGPVVCVCSGRDCLENFTAEVICQLYYRKDIIVGHSPTYFVVFSVPFVVHRKPSKVFYFIFFMLNLFCE